jgi:peptidoglycan DL-endopeptidase CwlO
VSSHNLGRHRAPHLSSSSSLSSAIWRTARPATKATAVIVISGAMVASLALPASAATLTTEVRTGVAATAGIAAVSAAQAPLVPRSFGDIGFIGVDKPEPVPEPVAEPVREAEVTSVSRSTTRTPVPAPSSSGVLGIAASLNGIPYVYGGSTPAGFDCSGFTKYIYNKVGVSLPRTAEEQRQFATTVSNPQPGDLVFFGSPATHMGIYAGNGMMWDSPHTGASVSKREVYSPSVTYGRV